MLRNSASINALLFGLTTVLFLLTPLIYTTSTKESYEFPKMFFVYFLGCTIAAIYLLKATWENKKTYHMFSLVGMLLVVNMISTVFSSHIYTSVWGYYSRFNGGFVSVAVFVGVFLVLANALNIAQREDILGLVLGGGGIVALYTIFQYFDHISLEAEFRAYGTIGQPNWTASYFCMLLPLSIYNYLKAKSRKTTLIWLCLFSVMFFALWLTFSISGLLGFVLATLAMSLTQKPLFAQKKKVAILAVIIMLPYFIAPGIFAQKIDAVVNDLSHINAADTVVAQESSYSTTTVSNAISDPGAIRLNLWRDSMKIVLSSPKAFLIGTGPETFPYAFQPHRSNALNYTSEWDFIFNKPHNYYLEILTELGIIGLLVYTALYMYLLLKLPKWLVPSLVAFLVTNFFGWPSVSTELLFVLLASFGFQSVHAEN